MKRRNGGPDPAAPGRRAGGGDHSVGTEAALRDAAASGDTAMLDAIARMLPPDDDAF